MANEVLKRDQNHVTVGGGVTNDASREVTMLRVDPVSKYVLATISVASSGSAISTQVAKRDQNYRPVCLAWDETNEVLQEILTDSNGYLLADITFI